MKKIISLALVLALGFQFLMKLGILTYFQLNQAYIIEMFCVNKEKPEMHCDGQCFLAKKLQAAEDSDHDAEGTRTANQKIDMPIFLIATPDHFSFKREEPALEVITIINHYSFVPLRTFFHPQKFIG